MKFTPCRHRSHGLCGISGLIALALSLLSITQCAAGNVVGYVNVSCTDGYQYLSNPLNTTNNSLNSLFQNPPDGTRAWMWNVTNQVFDPPVTFTLVDGWDGNFMINVGRGFALHTPTSFIHTFVGEVMQGTLINPVAGTNKFSLLGSMVPQGGPLSGILEFPGTEGDSAQIFSVPQQRFVDACNWYSGYGWFDPSATSGTNGPTINIATSFFVQHPGPDKNWVRNFTVQRPIGPAPPPEPVSEIGSLTIRDGAVTLKINKVTKRYTVQFSTDRVNWTTIAANQTATVWRGPLPPHPAGFFQIVNP